MVEIWPLHDVRTGLEEGKITLVDVRSAEEFGNEHIPGAVNIPAEKLEELAPGLLPDLDATVITYCDDAQEVTPFAAMCELGLYSMGYKNHGSLLGGLKSWKELSFPTTETSTLTRS
jgi:rhodanese-related sulfurtransferase